MITAAVDNVSKVGEMLAAITIPSEVASGPSNVDSSTVNGMPSNAPLSDGGTIRTVMPMFIENTIDMSNSTSSDNSGATNVLGNSGAGSLDLNNHVTDIVWLIVITVAVDNCPGTG